MAKDVLFSLHKDFADPKAGQGTFFCPSCAFVEGVLSYFPELREVLDIRKVDFPRPRPDIVELIGEENQGCPVLVLDGEPSPLANVDAQVYNGRFFITEPKDIATYLCQVHGFSIPH